MDEPESTSGYDPYADDLGLLPSPDCTECGTPLIEGICYTC